MARLSTSSQNLMKNIGILFLFILINSKFELFSLYSIVLTGAIFLIPPKVIFLALKFDPPQQMNMSKLSWFYLTNIICVTRKCLLFGESFNNFY